MSWRLSLAVKSRFSLLIVIAGVLIILCIPNVYSDFASNTKYLIQATGYVAGTQSILDSTFVLQITSGAQSGTNMLTSLDNGLVTIGGTNYLNTGSWQTAILRNGNFLLLQGDAEDQNGNIIHLNLFGRIVTSNQNGILYYITGKITGAETLKVIYNAKVTVAGATTIPQSTQTSNATTTLTSQNQTQSNVVTISIVPGASKQYNVQQHYFSPSVVNVRPGTTIIWTNNDNVPHRIESGAASALIGNNSAPVFTPDGMIDSGMIAPGQSFQYTITSFPQRDYLSDAAIKYLGLDPHQTSRGITFYDPNYPFMQGVIGETPPPSAQTQTAEIDILQGASTATSAKYLFPQTVQVTPGSTIIWKNDDSVTHRILSGHSQNARVSTKGALGGTLKSPYFIPDGILDTGTIAPGQTYSYTLKTGTGALIFYDAANTWLNGIIVSTSQISQMPPVQISILSGSYSPNAAASQSNGMYYNQYYSLTTVQITPGTVVVWTNNDNVAHQIWSGVSTQSNINPFTPDGKIESAPIPPGASFEVIINDTGITRFYDPGYTWMNGLIVSIPTVTGQQNIGGYYKNANPFLH
jgi:plastocyanin